MLRGRTGARAAEGPNDQRHVGLPAHHEVQLGGLVDHLVHRLAEKVTELDLDDRPHAGECGAQPMPTMPSSLIVVSRTRSVQRS